MKLIIVRHGESEGNTKEIFAGVTDVPLTEKGMEQARKTAEQGDIVILSPACASFDAFKNFEERGNRFKEIVKSW